MSESPTAFAQAQGEAMVPKSTQGPVAATPGFLQPLSRAERNVLRRLSADSSRWHQAWQLPNGHGHTVPRGAIQQTLWLLCDKRLIASDESGCYRITAAGLSEVAS